MRMSTVNSIEPKMETETEMNSKCPIGSLFKYFPLLVLSTDLRTQSSDFQRPQESTQFLKLDRTRGDSIGPDQRTAKFELHGQILIGSEQFLKMGSPGESELK